MAGGRVRKRLGLTILIILVVVALGAFTALQLATSNRVSDGVTVAGVDIGGLSREAALDRLQEELWPRVATAHLDVGDDEPVTLPLPQLGIEFDATSTVEAALTRGRYRLPLGLRVWMPGGGGENTPQFTTDAVALEDGLAAVREIVDSPARDAHLRLRSGWGILVTPSRDGKTVDAVSLSQLIVASAQQGTSFTGKVPMLTESPAVTTAEAEGRAARASEYFARPITLRLSDRTVSLAPETIADLVTVNLDDDAERYPLTFRNDTARRRLHKLLAWAERPPVDAGIEVHADGGITITESSDGEVIDMEFLLEDLDEAATSSGSRIVRVTTSAALPQLTTEDIREKGLSSLGAQFTTYFSPQNTARVNNIALAAKLVDGTLVAPGETFSLNEAMGPRTVNRGFDYAPVIAADGVLRQGVGGGICQYATTLFNAVLLAGLPVVDRREHSLYISHYPVGRDATVAWGSIDFKFRNDTSHDILIRSWVSGDALTVALVGKTGRQVKLVTGDFYDVHKPTHGKSNPRVIYDADLGPGVVRWEPGENGRSVKVQRTVRDSSGTLLFRDTFVSHYEPLDWVKRVGTD